MFSFRKNSLLLARRLDMIAAMAIVAMMSLTCADVSLLFRGGSCILCHGPYIGRKGSCCSEPYCAALSEKIAGHY
jgi:hypothetical protein